MIQNTSPHPDDVFLLKGVLHDEPVWYYVWVEKTRQPLFKKAADQGIANPTDFGTVLFYGVGEEPPLYYQEKVARRDYSQ